MMPAKKAFLRPNNGAFVIGVMTNEYTTNYRTIENARELHEDLGQAIADYEAAQPRWCVSTPYGLLNEFYVLPIEDAGRKTRVWDVSDSKWRTQEAAQARVDQLEKERRNG